MYILKMSKFFPQEDDRTEIRTTDLRVMKQTLCHLDYIIPSAKINRKSFNLRPTSTGIVYFISSVLRRHASSFVFDAQVRNQEPVLQRHIV